MIENLLSLLPKKALDKLLGLENNDNQIEDHEVDQYLSEKPAARTTQPLKWWKHNSHRFPNMYYVYQQPQRLQNESFQMQALHLVNVDVI